VKDREFKEFRLVLNGKAIQLRETGEEEEEILWSP